MKEKAQVNKLPVLPLPLIVHDSTKVIPCYRHNSLQGKQPERTLVNSTFETKDNFFNQKFSANDELIKNNNWTSVGQTSFDDKFNHTLAQRWIKLQQEAYESINMTTFPPSFRCQTPCLSSKTDNRARPLGVVKGMKKFLHPRSDTVREVFAETIMFLPPPLQTMNNDDVTGVLRFQRVT